jgi:hypothetical protein
MDKSLISSFPKPKEEGVLENFKTARQKKESSIENVMDLIVMAFGKNDPPRTSR